MVSVKVAQPVATRNAMASIVIAELFEVQADFATPYVLSKTYGTLPSTRAVLLKLTDVDGVVGWGEANPMQPFTTESPAGARQVLRDLLLPTLFAEGMPEPGIVDLKLDKRCDGHLCAKGAISMALLDIMGKRLRLPVAALIGGVLNRSLPVLWPLGAGTSEDDIRVIEERAAQGFTSYMLKMGAAPVGDEIVRVNALANRYGSSFKFIADANQGWTRGEAREFLKHACDLPLVFVEQPVAKEDIEGLAELARSTNLPISADESLTGLSEAARLAKLDGASIFSIKSSKNGGPIRAQRIATLAQAFGIRCYMNSMLEFGITQAASLQHAATLPNLVDVGHAYMSTLRLAEDPTNFSSRVRNGVVHLPMEPGLGIDVDEAHVDRMTVASDRVAVSVPSAKLAPACDI